MSLYFFAVGWPNRAAHFHGNPAVFGWSDWVAIVDFQLDIGEGSINRRVDKLDDGRDGAAFKDKGNTLFANRGFDFFVERGKNRGLTLASGCGLLLARSHRHPYLVCHGTS